MGKRVPELRFVCADPVTAAQPYLHALAAMLRREGSGNVELKGDVLVVSNYHEGGFFSRGELTFRVTATPGNGVLV